MEIQDLPREAQFVLLEDSFQRDQITARRVLLAQTLYRERYLTREHLIVRVEAILGVGCFGAKAWEDNFYRDMRTVKKSFKAAGYELAYSRSRITPGYYLRNQPSLAHELARAIEGSVAEIDPAQIAIYRIMLPSDRFRQACSISDTAQDVVAYRIHLRNPSLNLQEAKHQATTGKS